MRIPVRPLVITATPTLFDADESLAGGEIRRHLAWLKDRGVDGIFPAGTSGEFPTLSDDERIEILDLALDVFEPEQVYLHVGAASARQAVSLIRRALEHGAIRMAAITPFFQPAPEAQVVEYYSRLVDAAGDAELFAYLFEARTSTASTPSLLAKLADIGLAGAKISGESEDVLRGFLAERPEGFTVFSGNDVAFGAFIQDGGQGIVSGVSAVFPEAFVGLRDALIAADPDAISERQSKVERAVAAVRAGSLTHLKAGIAARGFAAGPVRTAVAGVSDEDRDVIEALTEQVRA